MATAAVPASLNCDDPLGDVQENERFAKEYAFSCDMDLLNVDFSIDSALEDAENKSKMHQLGPHTVKPFVVWDNGRFKSSTDPHSFVDPYKQELSVESNAAVKQAACKEYLEYSGSIGTFYRKKTFGEKISKFFKNKYWILQLFNLRKLCAYMLILFFANNE